MHCPIQNVVDYCAGKLLPDAAAEFERHMSVCSECQSLAMSQHRVWHALDTWEAKPVSEDFDRKLYARIEELEGERRWWPAWSSAWRPALSLGAVCAAIAIALVVSTPDRSESTRTEVEPEQVERALEDLEMLKQLSANGSQAL